MSTIHSRDERREIFGMWKYYTDKNFKTLFHLLQPLKTTSLSCLPGYHQSWRLGEAKQMTAAELRLLQTVQGQSAPFQITSRGKSALQFLSVHLVFAKRPHTIQSFKIILWHSKGCFLAMMIYGAASVIRALFEEIRWSQVALSGSEMLCWITPAYVDECCWLPRQDLSSTGCSEVLSGH